MIGENGSTAGWDAIDAALDALYGDAVPLHVAPELPSYLGGTETLDGISIFVRDEPVPHWHLVSYGMSDLYGAGTGRNFEFTLRAVRRPDAVEPPAWAVLLVQQLSAYVVGTGQRFEPGQTLRPGVLTLGPGPTELSTLAFVEDAELATVEGPAGPLTFIQIVALTAGEYAAADGDASAVLDRLAKEIPLHVIDPARGSLL
ncbi:suppressor of fused domain protein [Hamadaea tsunoensis]|uniref:suppressor of fused domain protein n=1 Tax=Hamadaea tsunoensis TaxID=53368 RepID=UPI00055812F1|nr:suppressor of fused domain protein [Hamadaea tsunoensis]